MTSRSRRKHRTTAQITAVRTANSHATFNSIPVSKLKTAFIASLGMLISLGSTTLCSAQIGSGVSQGSPASYTQVGPAYSQTKQTSVDRSQAGRSQRSAGRGTLSSVLLGTRNQPAGQPARPTPAYAQPQQQQPHSLPNAAPTPAQVYSQAFAYATQAGYPPAEAQAYGRQMVQQYQARQIAAQQAQLAMANGQQPAAVHGSMMHQHMEQQRVQMAHGQAAAVQNAKLMQAVQNQRAQMYRQAMAQRQAQAQAQMQAQWEAQQAVRDQQAELAAVRAASLKVAQQFATQSNAVLGGNAEPISPADSLTAQVLPSQYSQSVVSEEEVETLPLENAVEQMGQPVPEDIEWEMPAEIKQLPEEDANPLRRTPRRLPAVDPQPLPTKQTQPATEQELELELEGFSGDGQAATPVSYQQPVSQSYGSQGYAPQLAIGEELDSQTPEFYEQQLQVSPPQMTYGQPEKTFSVELESQDELPLSDPLFQDTNTNWDSQSAPTVKPPTGIRAQSVSTYLGPGHKRSRSGFPMSSVQEPDELELNSDEMSREDLPAPRAYDNDDLSRDSIVKSCDEMRQELLNNSIRSINLDLSTPLNSVVLEDASDEQKIRDWKDPNGNTLARGKAISATRYGVNIIDENGLARTLSLSTLSGTDQKHAWDLMDLPFECDLVASNILNHNFTPSTVTWYASALCHKPLYFEDIQLERYGHTKGPIRQPVRSAARFIGQAALLPYQIGLHPPNECQYALGLYRPGNCAPYLRTPFPWERRAVGYEAAALAGVFLLIP